MDVAEDGGERGGAAISDPHAEEEEPVEAISGRRVFSLANASEEVYMKDPLFPFSSGFASKSQREKELLFLHAFDEQTQYIRSKELRCVNSPVEPPLTSDGLQRIIDARQAFQDSAKRADDRKVVTRKSTEGTKAPPPRVETEQIPTFNSLLNTHFESQFSLLERFKILISELTVRSRAQRRTRALAQFLINERANALRSLQEALEEKQVLTAHSLLSLKIECGRFVPKFATPYHMDLPTVAEMKLDPHNIEHSFPFYTPVLVERYQFTPFPRTDITAFVAASIAPPEIFPVVREEQPIRERVVPTLDLEDPSLKDVKPAIESPPTPAPVPRVEQYPREIRYYPFDPSYCLRPQPITLPELPNEIGKSCILALPLAEYEKMSMTGKTKAPFALFEFTGVPKFAEAGLPVMNAADPIDLRELEADDDIDGIDIQPRPRPITDFLTKPLSTKNKSHVLAETVSDGQSQWRDRQRRAVNELVERIKALNALMQDKSLALPMDDLLEYLKQ
jgi:hypothetical protein